MMNKNSLKNFNKVFKNNWFIFKYAFKTVPLYTVLVCGIPASHMILQFFEFQYMAKYMIDCVQFSRPILYAAAYIAAVFSAVTLWLVVVNIFKASWQKKWQTKLYKHLQLDIYGKATAMDLECYDNPEFYTDFVWAMSEATKRTDAVLNTIADFGSGLALIASSGLFMILFDKIGMVFVTISFVLTFIVNIKINKLRFDLDVKLRPIQRKRDYINRVFYLNDFSKEIRLNDIKNMLYKDFRKSNDEITVEIKKRTKKLAVLSFMSGYLFNSFILDGLYVLYLIFRTTVLKALSYGTVVALLQSSWNLKNGLNTFAQVLPQFQQNSLYIDKLRIFMSYDSRIKNDKTASAMPESLSALELKNVSFSYNRSDKPVLKNINMTIKPREKIAIVGYNGAGKTTLIKLLLRLYDVTGGELLYAGTDIKNYDAEDYRRNFGAVFQDYQLFAASVAENVVMDDHSKSEHEVCGALEQSGFAGKLNSLADGVNTMLTREFDDEGTNLSGGEAQKLAIARVLYKNCNIIILDEPSSALDPISEYHLNDTLARAALDRTVIFISHRLSTTRMADRIYMLENGEIIEQGSHDELMGLNGKYAYMFNLQAEKYRTQDSLDKELCV